MDFIIKNEAGQSLGYEVNYDEETVTVYKDEDDEPEGLLVIPESVTYEGETYRVTSIGDEAFKDCEKLTSIIIPNTVTSIDHFAFCDCISLAAFNIPDSVISIGVWAFENTAWENNLSDGIMYKDGWCLGYKGNQPSGTLSIQEGTKGIGRAAFQDCTALTSVTLPHTTIVIGEFAFAGCAGLATITIPDSVTTIDWRAFEKCTGLTSISLPNSLMSIEDGVFDGCTALTSIAIPKSVTSIGEGAFSGCSSLTAVTIPNAVSVIKRAAFEDCIKLADFTIPDSVTELTRNAFYNTAWWNNQPNGVLYKDGWYLGWNGLNLSEEICIEEGTKGIAKPAFLPEDATIVICKALTPPAIKRYIYGVEKDITIYVPAESLEAYQNADGWKEYNIQPIKEEIGFIVKNEAGQPLRYKVNEDEKTVTICRDGNNIPEGILVIPESVTYEGKTYRVTSIGNGVFYGCTGLTSITIPNTVTSIGEYAFEGCTALTSFIIPDSVTRIEWRAFCGCSGLTSVTIPNSVISIGVRAFVLCSRLTEITIPNSVTSIGSNAFIFCPILTSIICEAIIPPQLEGKPFYLDVTIYVPAQSVEAYRKNEMWKEYNIQPIQ